jgi:ribosomal protein L11 methyltransferase
MFLMTALGAFSEIRAAAAAFDGLDPSPADAVSWFEEGGGKFRIEIYVATEQDEDSARAVIAHVAPDLHVNIAPIEDADWVAMSLDGLPPVFAGRFVVAGSHALANLPKSRNRIWIEASEAFGTGHHGTTRGCLLALEYVLRRRRVKRCLDIGAGSAVLAIAAAQNGAEALAVEIDPRPAQIGRENIKNNRVTVRMLTADGYTAALKAGLNDLVFANILMRPLSRLEPALARATAPGGTLVVSGLLTSQMPLILKAYSRHFTLERRWRLEGWAALALRRRYPLT